MITSACLPSDRSFLARSSEKKVFRVGIPAASGGIRRANRRVNAEDGDALLGEITQHITIIAGRFDHQAVGV